MTVTLTMEIDSKWSMRLARAAVALRHLIGNERAFSLGYWVAYRMARWRIGDGPWHRGVDSRGCCPLTTRGQR